MSSNKYARFDVTIAGAGPTGSILAYELAKQGVKVLLLEKHKFPRNKVCAGGVTVRAASVLPFNFDELILSTIYGVRLSFKMVPKKVRVYDQPLAYMVMRDIFDDFLASKARQAGAVLEEGVEIRHVEIKADNVAIITNLEAFSTPILVGADGANSAVVRSLGLKEGFEYGIALNGHIAVNREVYSTWNGLMGLDYGVPGGYAWIFPKKNCLAVGAGSSFREAKKLRPYTLRLIQSYDLGSIVEQQIQGHLMPSKKRATALSNQRVLLVGDAAGLIDPLAGEGMYYGIRSSHLAAATLRKFLEGKIADMSEYDGAISREIMPELGISRTIQRLNSFTPRFFFYLLEENDRVWRAFCKMLRGEKTYQSLVNSLNPALRWLFRVF